MVDPDGDFAIAAAAAAAVAAGLGITITDILVGAVAIVVIADMCNGNKGAIALSDAIAAIIDNIVTMFKEHSKTKGNQHMTNIQNLDQVEIQKRRSKNLDGNLEIHEYQGD